MTNIILKPPFLASTSHKPLILPDVFLIKRLASDLCRIKQPISLYIVKRPTSIYMVKRPFSASSRGGIRDPEEDPFERIRRLRKEQEYRWHEARKSSNRRPDYEENGSYNNDEQWSSPKQSFIDRFREIFRINRTRFIILTSIGAAYYFYHLEDTPITHRRRFITVTPREEAMMSELSLRQLMQQFGGAMLPAYHPTVRRIETIANKILTSILVTSDGGDTGGDSIWGDYSINNNIDDHNAINTKIMDDVKDSKQIRDSIKSSNWRIFVVNAPGIANAFVLPGGQIFVFTGILPVAATDAGIAAILGHEIAHKLARHIAEKVSKYQFFGITLTLLQLIVTGGIGGSGGMLSDMFQYFVLNLPHSRRCEVEADEIGLYLMAKACYNPEEAIGLWRRMEEHGKKERGLVTADKIPSFLSTHPSHKTRLEKINAWLPRAKAIYDAGGCSEMQRRKRMFLDTVMPYGGGGNLGGSKSIPITIL